MLINMRKSKMEYVNKENTLREPPWWGNVFKKLLEEVVSKSTQEVVGGSKRLQIGRNLKNK